MFDNIFGPQHRRTKPLSAPLDTGPGEALGALVWALPVGAAGSDPAVVTAACSGGDAGGPGLDTEGPAKCLSTVCLVIPSA
jgi:hypothetical protein